MRIEFAREYCTRCGGTGLYPSACTPAGRCYMCFQEHGKPGGMRLSRAGRRAKTKYHEWIETALRIRASDVTPGMQVSGSGGERRRSVIGVEWTDRSGAVIDGVCQGSWAIQCRGVTLMVPRDGIVYRAPTPDEMRAIAATLGKGATLVENEAVQNETAA